MNVSEPPGGSSAYLLPQDNLCGEFDQECVYGLARQSQEFSGGFVDFLLGRGGRHPRADADWNTRFYQCTRKSASRVVAPEIMDPMMAIDGTTPFGGCRLMSDATKIAAAGNAITK
jgi:hypothetical protein